MSDHVPTDPVQPVAAPEHVPAPVAEPVVAAVVAPEPVVEPAVEAPAVTPHTETETLLEAAGKPPEGEAKPAEPVAEVKAPEPPAPEPRTYTEFTFPDGVKAEPEQVAKFTEALSKHNLDQEAGQALMDMHTEGLRKFAENTLADQHRVFSETRAAWRQQIMADDQLGGAGHQTTIAAVARMRDLLVPEQNRDAFNQFLRVTGAGDHPEFLRVLHNAARHFDEPAVPSQQGGPLPNRGQPSGGGLRSLYTHPRSNIRRGG